MIGNDTAITIGGMQGHFELNVRIPLIARNLLQSIGLLSSTAVLFAEKCVDGIEANLAGCEASAEGTLAVATALNPYIGYDKASEIVKDAAGERADAARGRAGARRGRGDARRGARPAQDRRGLSGVVTAGGTDAALLQRIEAYFDAAPRPAADVEQHGPLTLFVSRIPWRFYGRPRIGLSPRDAVGADDVRALRARQRELGVREALEWVRGDDAVARRGRRGGGHGGADGAAARGAAWTRSPRRPACAASRCACSAPTTRRSSRRRTRSRSPSAACRA